MGVNEGEPQFLVDLANAQNARQELQQALQEANDDKILSCAEELNKHTSKLGLLQWKLDDAKLSNRSMLHERLGVLDRILSSCTISPEDNQLNDEQVVAQASGGAALFGLNLGASEENLIQRARNAVLSQPLSCTLTNPVSEIIMGEQQFASISEATKFRSIVKSCGKSFAIGVNGAYEPFNAGASYSNKSQSCEESKALQSSKTTNVVHITYAYVPIKSFCFGKQSMCLSEEARAAALQVDDDKAAEYFLQDYGSHVSTGDYQLGGIYWKVVEMTVSTATDSAAMLAECRKHSDGHLSVGYTAFGFGVGIDVQASSFEVDSDSSGSNKEDRECTITTKLEFTGPDAPSYEIFRQKLDTERQTWYLIDRPASAASLIGLWDLLAEVEDCKFAADLIREAWLKQVQPLSHLPNIQQAMQRARIKAWLCDPKFTSDIRNTDVPDANAAELVARRQVESIYQLNFSDPKEGNAVAEVFLLLLRLDLDFDLNLTVESLRQEKMQNTLCKLAKANCIRALQNLSVLFTNVIDAKLSRVSPHVKMDNTFMTAMRDASQLASLSDDGDDWHAPKLDAANIPTAIEQLAATFYTTPMPDMHLLTTRIGELLTKNLASCSSEEQQALRAIAVAYDWHGNGFYDDLNKEHVRHLVSEMKDALEGKNDMCESYSEDEIPTMSPFAREKLPPATHEFPISSLLVVNARPDKAIDLPGLILYTLKHRLSMVKEIYATNKSAPSYSTPNPTGGRHAGRSGGRSGAARGGGRSGAGRSGGRSGPARGGGRGNFSLEAPFAPEPQPVVFDALLALAASLTPTARAEIYRLLLDRRFLVPFLAPTAEGMFKSEATVLDLVETTTSNGRISLMRDVEAIRVAVISQRPTKSSATKDWIKNVFHVDSIHCLDRVHGNNVTQVHCAAELGWGFVQENAVFTTVIVLHVIGDATPLLPFIDEFADVLIVDVGTSDDVTATLSRGCIIHWQNADEDEDDEEIYDESQPDIYTAVLRCSIPSSHSRITHYILHECGDIGHHAPLDCIELPRLISRSSPVPMAIHTVLQQTDFSKLRSETLKLQLLFAHEAKYKIALQRETNTANRQVLERKIQEIQARYERAIRKVKAHPLICFFVCALELPDASIREMVLVDLERRLAESCEGISQVARDDYRRAREELNRMENKQNHQAYLETLETWGFMVTGMEHLWREISHIFASDPTKYSQLSSLAVQHLLDGFPLELMDGDASMVNMKWIRAILNRLGDQLPKGSRVFVLSIMGVQSSGKSTLLNYMFGVRLRTSVSRCTRGVNIQLLKCEGRAEYDYILLLDTEGIRSPEYIGAEDSVWRDNRMASLAILPSDATIILTKGESTVTISEILPIVLSVYLDSELAERHGGHLTSNFYFAFNQIDLSQASNMETIVDTLMKNLRENAKKIESIRANDISLDKAFGKAESSTEYFRDFQTNIRDEDSSDVRFLGLTQGPSEPPLDAPLCDYGERLLKFRDHIHKRACLREWNWKGRTFAELKDCFELVWGCIGTSNFQMDFIAAHERLSYECLVRLMTEHTQELSKIYSVAFNDVLKIISADNANEVPFAKGSRKYENLLVRKVQDEVFKLDTIARAALEHEKFAKWKLSMEIKWEQQKTSQEAHSLRLVADKVQHVFLYETYVKSYKNQLHDALTTRILQGNFKLTSEAFDGIFEEVLERARRKHPPMAPDVPGLVHKVIFENHVFQPDILVKLQRRNNKHEVPSNSTLDRFIHGFQALVTWGGHNARRQQPEEAVRDFVMSELADVERYSADVVMNCVIKTKEMMYKKKVPNTKQLECFWVLYQTLCYQLQFIQNQWDLANSVVTKFASCKPSMKLFAENLCKGHKAADLLIVTLDEWLKESLPAAFQEELVSEVASLLKGQMWVQSAEAMQAALDKDLLERLSQNDIQSALGYLTYPLDHNTIVTTRLIQVKVEECFFRVADVLSASLNECFVHAAAAAEKVDRNRSDRFVHEIRLRLQECLKRSGTSALVENLPKADSDVMNCDDQGPLIFSIGKSLNVLRSVLESLEEHKANIQPAAFYIPNIAADVLRLIRDEAFGAVSGVVPRCGKPCPNCGCPCTKALGHVSSKNSDEVPHDTYHQPVGITGGSWVESKRLVEKSCPLLVIQDANIVFKDGTKVPYKEFDRAYPGWAIPQLSQPLPLREYIFAHYQDELSQLHNKPKANNIPREYNHDLDDISRRINEVLHGLRQ